MSLIRLLSAVLFCAVGLAAASDIDLRTLCEWPVIYASARPAVGPTKLAQRMLNFYLQSEPNFRPIKCDGYFGPETTAAVKSFEKVSGIPDINGILDRRSWPALVKRATPLHAGANVIAGEGRVDLTQLVLGLQERLISLGFGPARNSPFPNPGKYDNVTTTSVARFQAARGATSQDGQTVDEQTWHLLSTNCNSSTLNDHAGEFFFDAGWPQGVLSVESLQCLRATGFSWGTFECWREYSGWWNESVANVANALAAGFESVGVYVFPVRTWEPTSQVSAILGNLSLYRVRYDSIMLDIEGSDWTKYSTADNAAFMRGMLKAFETHGKHNIIVYCGAEWPNYFGKDFDLYARAGKKLVYAHYDLVPSFEDWIDTPYGGWTAPNAKQFWDGADQMIACGTGPLDWDWAATRFWQDFR